MYTKEVQSDLKRTRCEYSWVQCKQWEMQHIQMW